MRIKILLSGIVVVGLLIGCSSEQTQETPKEESTTEIKVEAAANETKEWKDKSITAKEFIAMLVDESNKIPREHDEDEGYSQYLFAKELNNALNNYVRVEGEDLEKDFETLAIISSYIGHLQFVRTAKAGRWKESTWLTNGSRLKTTKLNRSNT
ncbi:hypothetical protein [Mesobacillus maritimus]|uniref:Uncharacterized protein n=1 Tax=Mesobacillus maritimus TaxID=1643336 RepID=A0ABS7K8U1_9BACI|nr:hypothetical protein [Mesobacillus maritimus]MBY0098682.1 hypothetical protein [Mesobacillus maritimus]